MTTPTGIKLGIPQLTARDGTVLADWPPEVERDHRVYFVRAGDPDAKGYAPVKIGFTTDVGQRMRQLQTASPEPLTLLDVVVGTQAIEAFFHRELAPRRIRGEWFKLRSDDVSEAVARLCDEGLVAAW